MVGLPQAFSQDRIRDLREAMTSMPQAPGMQTHHFFAGGMYCRRIHIPHGYLIVSKIHKTEHLFIGCSGELQVAGQGETYILRAGDVIPSAIGTCRAVLALSDVICMTVHKTDTTDFAALEAEMVEAGGALYDVNNQPKPGVLVSDSQELIQ